MQTVMLRLDALIRRRRGLFLGAWALIVIAALPFAARQADHLTGGGFDVPGSQSVAVQQAVERDFEHAQGTTLAAVLVPRAGRHDRRAARRAIAKVGSGRRRRRPRRRSRRPPARRRCATARRATARARSIVPLRPTSVSDSDAIDVAVDLRKPLGIADADRRRAGRAPPRRPGRAVGRHAGPLQGGPRLGRGDRLPDRAADPARGLRLARARR